LKSTTVVSRVEDLEDLRACRSRRSPRPRLARQLRAGRLLAGRVADEAGEVADEEDDLVAELLEVAHLAEDDRVAEVEVGRGGVEADLDQQLPAAALRPPQLVGQLLLGHHVDAALGQVPQLLIDIEIDHQRLPGGARP
jgi:hypothetical protein